MSRQQSERLNVPVPEARITVLTWALGLLCSGAFVVTAAAIPWAMLIQSDVSSMATQLNILTERATPPEWFKAQVDRNTADIEILKKDVHKLESGKQFNVD